MAEFADYDEYDGLGLAELVRRGDVSPDDLMDTAMARVAARNLGINAFSALFESRARGDIRTGLPPGPFHGVPFALKDLFMHYEGEVTGNGSRFFAGAVSTHDSELFTRYRRAGFAIRQDDDPRSRPWSSHGVPCLWNYTEPVGLDGHLRRLQRRCGRSRCSRHSAARACQRQRWIDARSGILLRFVRPEADQRANADGAGPRRVQWQFRYSSCRHPQRAR